MLLRLILIGLVLLPGCVDNAQSRLARFSDSKQAEALQAVEKLAPGMEEVLKRSRLLFHSFERRLTSREDVSIFVYEMQPGEPSWPEDLAWSKSPTFKADKAQELEFYLQEEFVRIGNTGTIHVLNTDEGRLAATFERWQVAEGDFLLVKVTIQRD
ncbi:hypothetical protein [Bremerella sp.]|uniref:hypothetical protein n=1 Tax=Bremerella sp. TaxID=2795602 RepID=UPI00391DBE4D